MRDKTKQQQVTATMVLAVLFAATGAAAQTGNTPGSLPEVERAALLAIYDALDGPNWDLPSWAHWVPENDRWSGVEIRDGRVLKLDLSGWRGIRGSIPPEIGVFELGYLRIYRQPNLIGPLPPDFGQIKARTYEEPGYSSPFTPAFLINYNPNLGGPIPAELGQIDNLPHLDLSRNNLSGPIPGGLGELISLNRLYLEGNNLSGPIPAELGKLINLDTLHLYDNNLSGPIPVETAQMGSAAVSPDGYISVVVDGDTGLCLPVNFPDSPVKWSVRRSGVPDCDAVVPVLPWPAIFALGAGLLAAGLARLRRAAA